MAWVSGSANRSLIAFSGWSSFAHAAVMTVMAFQRPDERDLLWGVAVLVIIGVALIVLRQAVRGAGVRSRCVVGPHSAQS